MPLPGFLSTCMGTGLQYRLQHLMGTPHEYTHILLCYIVPLSFNTIRVQLNKEEIKKLKFEQRPLIHRFIHIDIYVITYLCERQNVYQQQETIILDYFNFILLRLVYCTYIITFIQCLK